MVVPSRPATATAVSTHMVVPSRPATATAVSTPTLRRQPPLLTPRLSAAPTLAAAASAVVVARLRHATHELRQRLGRRVGTQALAAVSVVQERTPRRVLLQRGGVAHHPHGQLGTRERHVHAAHVLHEADAGGGGTHAREEHDVALLALEAVHRAHAHGGAAVRAQHAPQLVAETRLLLLVRRHHGTRRQPLLTLNGEQLLQQRRDEARLRRVAHGALASGRLVLAAAADVEEHVRQERPSLQERRRGAGRHARAVREAALVEEARGEGAHVRVHAVLLRQHQRRHAHRLQALEQAALQVECRGLTRQHGGRQLVGVAHQHGPRAAQLQRDERLQLRRLPRLVDQHGVEAVHELLEHLAAAGVERGEDDLRLVEERRLERLGHLELVELVRAPVVLVSDEQQPS